jgi:hypothetical protein
MTTVEMIKKTKDRLLLVYDRTLYDLYRLPTGELVEMEHEADEYKGRKNFNDRLAGEIVSTECRIILDQRK